MIIEVGDIVKIKEWDVLECEGQNTFGDIWIEEDNILFLSQMRYLCGKELFVLQVSDSFYRPGRKIFRLADKVDGVEISFYFSLSMFEETWDYEKLLPNEEEMKFHCEDFFSK